MCQHPCRCSTTARVVAYIQAFGHHDDIGGRVPGSMPGTARTVVRGGARGAAHPSFTARGVRNEAVFTIVKRKTRVPETLAADLDSEVQACVMGARRMAELFRRFGTDGGSMRCRSRRCSTTACRDIYRNEVAAQDRGRRICLGRLRRA